MKLSDLKYEYPEELVATQPVRPSRVMFVGENEDQPPIEIAKRQLLEKIEPGDVLTINNTKVLKRRVFAKNESEILFLDFLTPQEILELSLGIEIKDDVIHENKKKFWKVLFPSKKLKVFEKVELPNGFVMTLLQKGRPQIVKIEPAITESDFEKIAELPLPPYIQKARDQRHNVTEDESWYQTAWA